jgi:hypothetical protein
MRRRWVRRTKDEGDQEEEDEKTLEVFQTWEEDENNGWKALLQ